MEISKNIYLIINFICETKKELEELKDKISFVKSYINEAAPSIEVKVLMNALQESAFQDGLTGLYNRKFLEEHSKKLVPQIKRENLNIGVLLLDMDHFKAVNDEYGHDYGDKVLVYLSNKLKEYAYILNGEVYRYGGEEFLILCFCAKDFLKETVSRLKEDIKYQKIFHPRESISITVSIGVAFFSTYKNKDIMLRKADEALLEAKSLGRDTIVYSQ